MQVSGRSRGGQLPNGAGPATAHGHAPFNPFAPHRVVSCMSMWFILFPPITRSVMSRLSYRIVFAIIVLVAVACGRGPRPGAMPASSPAKVVGYLASWGVRSKGTKIAELPGDQLTHIIYAFANITDDGKLALGDPCLDIGHCDSPAGAALPSTDGGNFAELRRLKERYPHLKLLVAAGGWTGSGRFSDVALTAESRRTFAQSAVDLVIRRSPGLFDGIDIDWEYPVRAGSRRTRRVPRIMQNCTLLLQALRNELDAQGKRDGRQYFLSIATIAGPSALAHFELVNVSRRRRLVQRDDVRLSLRARRSRTSTRRCTPRRAIQRRATRSTRRCSGTSPAACRARSSWSGCRFTGVCTAASTATNDGLFQPAPGPVPDEWRTGTDYRAIVRRNPESLGFRRVMHPEARVPIPVQCDDRHVDHVRRRGVGCGEGYVRSLARAWWRDGLGDRRRRRHAHRRDCPRAQGGATIAGCSERCVIPSGVSFRRERASGCHSERCVIPSGARSGCHSERSARLAVIPSGAPQARSRGIAIVPIEGFQWVARFIHRCWSRPRGDGSFRP